MPVPAEYQPPKMLARAAASTHWQATDKLTAATTSPGNSAQGILWANYEQAEAKSQTAARFKVHFDG